MSQTKKLIVTYTVFSHKVHSFAPVKANKAIGHTYDGRSKRFRCNNCANVEQQFSVADYHYFGP